MRKKTFCKKGCDVTLLHKSAFAALKVTVWVKNWQWFQSSPPQTQGTLNSASTSDEEVVLIGRMGYICFSANNDNFWQQQHDNKNNKS